MNKIFGLQNVVRTMEHRDVVVRFRSKVKLHGTNAGIYFDENGNAHPMKKSGIIPEGEDNFGFAEYVHSRE